MTQLVLRINATLEDMVLWLAVEFATRLVPMFPIQGFGLPFGSGFLCKSFVVRARHGSSTSWGVS